MRGDAIFGWPAGAKRGGAAALRNPAALLRAVRRFRPDVLHSFSRLGTSSRSSSARSPRSCPTSATPAAARSPGRRGWRDSRSVSRAAANSSARWGGRPAATGRAIPNFVELEKFTFVRGWPRTLRSSSSAAIESIKGPDIAIDIARASGRRLILAGNRAACRPGARLLGTADRAADRDAAGSNGSARSTTPGRTSCSGAPRRCSCRYSGTSLSASSSPRPWRRARPWSLAPGARPRKSSSRAGRGSSSATPRAGRRPWPAWMASTGSPAGARRRPGSAAMCARSSTWRLYREMLP